MRKRVIGGVALAAASVGLVGAAHADGYSRTSAKDAPVMAEAVNWNGAYIGAAIGYGIATTDVDLKYKGYDYGYDEYKAVDYYEGSSSSLFSLDGISSEGVQGTITVGYDRQIHPGVLAGIFADYTFGDLDTNASLLGAIKLDAEISDTWSVGARLGLIRSNTLWYAMAGYTESDLNWKISAYGYKLASGGENLTGYFIGGGVEHQLARGLTLKAEYRFSDYDQVTLAKGYGLSLDTETDVHSVRVGVAWKFDMFDRTPEPVAPLK